ncbi:MAG: pentapeptide repeat-containing protein [Microcystis aeruginosa L111-01]|nr:pentapeptide repeat-containing protein [Microcystis aeruginosa L111-01]
MTIDLNAITRTRIPAKKIINQYKEGRRDFRNLDLRNYSFKKQDLRDADFSGSDIRGCSFEGATLENTNFSSVITGFSQSYWFNLFVSAVFGFLIWNYCLTFTAKYIEMITNPFKVAVEGILGIYVAEIVIIFAYGIVKCLSSKTFRAILRIFYQYRPRFHTETRRAFSSL